MPAKCPYCETNSHSPPISDEKCERNFLTPSEAWAIIAEDKKPDETVHVFSNPKANMLIGADWSRNDIKRLLETCKSIDHCDKNGKAREMKHGLMVQDHNDWLWFVETDEHKLKCYEELYGL